MVRRSLVRSFVPILALVGCASATSAIDPGSSHPQASHAKRSEAPTPRCGTVGDYVTASLQVGDQGLLVVSVENVRASLVSSPDRPSVDVTAPFVFEGTSASVDVHYPRAPAATRNRAMDANVRFTARGTVDDAGLRLSAGGFDFVAPCRGVVAGAPLVSSPATTIAHEGARVLAASDEVTVFARPTLDGEPIAWFRQLVRGSADVRAISADVMAITLYGDGVRVRGFIRTNEFRGPGMFGTGSGPARAPTGPTVGFTVPAGTSVYSTPDAAAPWARTSVPFSLAGRHAEGGRVGVDSVRIESPCGSDCADADRRGRVVTARRYLDRGAVPAIWFDASDVVLDGPR